MIKKATFKNVRALRDAVLPLAPVTLIVGPNGSGKSTALRALCADQAVVETTLGAGTNTEATVRLEFCPPPQSGQFSTKRGPTVFLSMIQQETLAPTSVVFAIC